MSLSKAVPDGLKDQECERGRPRKRPPIPYVPTVDELQDSIVVQNRSLKLKLSDTTELRVPIYHAGSPESFLNHVQTALGTCEKLGLVKQVEEASKREIDAANAADAYSSMCDVSEGDSTKKKKADKQQRPEDDFDTLRKKELQKVRQAKSQKTKAIDEMFPL